MRRTMMLLVSAAAVALPAVCFAQNARPAAQAPANAGGKVAAVAAAKPETPQKEAAGKKSAAPAKTVKVEFAWELQDQRSWQMFFLLDAAKRRLGSRLEVKTIPIISKENGKFSAPRGDIEVAESRRVAVLSARYPSKVWDYLWARTFNASEGAWKDAAVYAGVDPAKLEAAVSKEGDAELEKAWQYVSSRKIQGSSMLVNSAPYQGDLSLVAVLRSFNSMLGKEARIELPAAAPVVVSTAAPAILWIVVSTGMAGADQDAGLTAGLTRILGKPEVMTIPYELTLQKPEFKELNIDFLPYYFVAATPDTEAVFKPYLDNGMVKRNGRYFIITGGTSEGVFLNKERKPGELELFVMAHCPYGVQAQNAFVNAINKGLMPKDVKLTLRYILSAKKGADGVVTFSSLHGSAEWEEDLRQLIIAKNYPDKLWKYIEARNADYTSSLWDKAAAAAGIDPQEVLKNFDASKGLLEAEAAYSEANKVSGSPTFLWEGRTLVGGIAGLKKIPGFEKVEPVQGGAAAQGSCNK